MRPQQLCLGTHSIELISRQPAQHAFRLSSGRREHDQVAKTVEEILHKPARIPASFHDSVHHGEQSGAIPGRQGAHGVVEQGDRREAEERGGQVVAHAVFISPGHELIENRE